MNKIYPRDCVWASLLMVFFAPLLLAQEPETQPWQKPYTGDDATGPSVLALWQFAPGAEDKDSSGHGYTLKLRGKAAFRKEGRFGGCLESFGPATDEKGKEIPSGAEAPQSKKLTPPGPFTLEMWIKPKPEFDTEGKAAWLLDKMYVNYKHKDPKQECLRDYALILGTALKGRRTLIAHLGFAEDMVTYTSRPLRFEPGVWHHIAFAYDGAGTGKFYVDGEYAGGGSYPGRKGVAPGSRPVCIGDRQGSSYNGFPGFISEVRISNIARRFYSGTLSLAVSGRTAFVRMEPKAQVEWTLTSNRSTLLERISFIVSLEGAPQRRFSINTFAPDDVRTFEIPIDTRLRPGQYLMRGWVQDDSGKTYCAEVNFPVSIVPRPLPHRMPVVMWGGPDIQKEEILAQVKRIGFTHILSGPPVDYHRIWTQAKPGVTSDQGGVENYQRLLDFALANGLGIAAYPAPARWLAHNRPEMRRVDRSGKPYEGRSAEENICGLSPGAQEFCYNVGASIARTFGRYPALQAANIQSEIRDSTQVCFHEWDKAAFRKHAGFEIPAEVTGKHGVNYRRIPGFPTDRIVPDDYPLLVYYRWFWKDGDGWNLLHSAVHRGLKSTGRKDLWTWFDPAVRVPSIYGSGGEVDVISQWTYSYPDPIRIGLATDELFAMAAGAKRPQKVMKMTQIIWYRSGTAPKPKPGEPDKKPRAAWLDTVPDADFLTIAPDHLREAFWCKIARPIQGIMYHGWQSLVDTGAKKGYCFTHPKTQDVLAELTRTVVRPLGPTLLQVPDRPSDVGFLESFASQMFAGKGSWGWGSADMHLILQYAQLQPQVLYEETILQRGLDGFKVLVMSDCDVLPRTVAQKVQDFQRKGGLIVGDEFLAPAILPDIRLPSYKRTGKAHEDKAALLARAAELRKQLDPFYRRYSDSTNPEVVTRVRTYRGTDYLFAVNDRREYGDYVGQYGLVMEKGLPNKATLTLARRSGYVYDLVAGKPVTATTKDDRIEIQREFGPGDGALLMVTERPIAGVTITAPREARLGKDLKCLINVVDDAGKPIDAIVPVKIDITDPDGHLAEFSGFYGAKDGRLEIRLDIATNDHPGQWRIRAQELASGQNVEHVVRVAQ